jgi:SPP1 gp7 family putative phage head morphogenesis protein
VISTLRIDPTKTTLLRRAFMADVSRRFFWLRKRIEQVVSTEDALGLAPTSTSLVLHADQNVWRFATDDQKLAYFQRWFKKQVAAGILEVDAQGQPWTAKYVDSAYKKGLLKSYMDAHKADLIKKQPGYKGTKEEYLRSSFLQPERVSKVKMLALRPYEDLNGISAVMGQHMAHILSQGMADGSHPTVIARKMTNTIKGLTRQRALTIARTEVIHAHAEGQLDTFEDLGVDKVGLEAEWLTAKDLDVCPLCKKLEGVVMSVDEARGLLPRHPNCRCAWAPALRGHKRTGQIWGKKQVGKALQRSLREEGGAAKSSWAGKELV